MLKEYELFSKDYIKFYFLNETVNTKTVSFRVFLESDGAEKDFLSVRSLARSVYRFNNFNVSEDNTNNCITFRPNVIGCYVRFVITTPAPVRVEMIRNGTNSVSEAFELETGCTRLEFQPQNTKKYDLKITQDNSSEPAQPAGVNPSAASSVSEVMTPTANAGKNIERRDDSAVSEPPVFDPSPRSDVPQSIPVFDPGPVRSTPKPNLPETKPVQTEPSTAPAVFPLDSPTDSSGPISKIETDPPVFDPFQETTAPSQSVPVFDPSPVSPPPEPARPSVSQKPSDIPSSPMGFPWDTSANPAEQKKEKEKVISQLEMSNSRLQSDISALEAKCSELERKNQDLSAKKQNLTARLDKLQEEFDKDYASYNDDVQEIKSRYTIDAEILKLYEDKDVTQIEIMIKKAETDIEKIEDQIRLFVEAKEKKTAEIENELKIGKKE